MTPGVDIALHLLTVGIVLVTGIVTVTQLRSSQTTIGPLIALFRDAMDLSRFVSDKDRALLRRALEGVSRLEAAGVVVADDLAAGHARADATSHSDPPGTAADAASRQEPT